MGQYLDDKGVLSVWARIKAYAVMGHPIDQTSYTEAWREQARKNLGMADSTPFGRSLLTATSKTVFADLYADRAQKDLNGNVITSYYLGKNTLSSTGNEGSVTRPIFLEGYKAKQVTGISVPGNIESTNGGVSAKGISDLAVSFGGGGTGSVNAVVFGNAAYEEGAEYQPDYMGIITLPKRPDLSIYATQQWALLNFGSASDVATLKGYMPTGVSSTNKLATQSQIDTINGLIPSAATTSNKLADKAWVNSTIATETATFKGTFDAKTDLGFSTKPTDAQIIAKLPTKISGADNNDYCFVAIPPYDSSKTGVESYRRYKYNGTAWSFEYELNNSSFTSDQWSSINSGITASGVAQIGTNKTDISTLKGYFTNGIANTAAKLSNTAKIGDTNKPVYFSANGVPVAIDYTIGRNVAANEDVTPYTAGTNGNIGISEHKISINMTAVSNPNVDGVGLSFVDSVTQATNGSITVHRRNVQEASRTQVGVVNTGAQEFKGNKSLYDGSLSVFNGGVSANGLCDLSISGVGGGGVVDLYTNWADTPTSIQALGAQLAKDWHDAWLGHIASGVNAGVTPLHVSASEKAVWNAKQDAIANVTDSESGFVSKVTQTGGKVTITHKAFTKPTISLTTAKISVTTDGGTSTEVNIPTWNQDTTGSAAKLGGNTPDYYATASGLTAVANGLSAAASVIEDIRRWTLSPSADTMSVGTLNVDTINLGGEEYSGASDIIASGSKTLTIQKNGTQVGTYKPNADATINLTDVASATALSTEIADRKANDVASIAIGKIAKRNYKTDETPADLTAPALKFNRTDGKHLDIPRGTEVDIIASNLVGDALPQTDQMFTYRTTAGDASIKPTGTAHINKLSGNTIAWNQMLQKIGSDWNSYYKANVVQGIELTSDGGLRVWKTTNDFVGIISKTVVMSNTHKYIVLFDVKNNNTTNPLYVTGIGAISSAISVDAGKMKSHSLILSNRNGEFILHTLQSTNADATFYNLNLFDLTQMFGSDASICKALGVANLTDSANQTKAIANFKAMFPNSYYPYNAGELVSFGGQRRVWKNLVKNGDFKNGTSEFGADGGVNTAADGILTTTISSAAQGGGPFWLHRNTITANHKFYFKANAKLDWVGTCQLQVGNIWGSGVPIGTDWTAVSDIMTPTTVTNTIEFNTNTTGHVGAKIYTKNWQLYDLTETFGAGNEPTTVEEVEMWLKGEYLPYNEPTTLTFDTELESVGRNLWDEQWQHGYYDGAGGFHPNDSYVASKNMIRVLPNTKYAFSSGKGYLGRLCFYDANGIFVSSTTSLAGQSNAEVITPNYAFYLNFDMQSGYGGTYLNDITISLAWSGSRTGYEPYERHTLPVTPYVPEEFKKKAYELGDLVLHEGAMYKRTANGGVKKDWADTDWTMIRCAGGGIGQALSAGAVRDEYYEDHCVIRLGSFKASNITVSGMDSSSKLGATNVMTPESCKVSEGTVAVFMMISDKLGEHMPLGDARGYVGICMTSYLSRQLYVRNASITQSVAAYNTWLQSLGEVTLYYELAEPITIWYDKKDFDYFADDYGTEGWIPQTGSTPRFVPPYMDITYGINVVDEVRQLPAKYFENKQFTQSNVTELFKENKEVSNQMLANLGSNLETVYGDGTDPNRLMGFELAMGFDGNGEEKSVTFGIITDEWINQNLN